MLLGTLGVAAPVAVDFVNASRATRCAEEDNVYVKLLAAGIASFRISAEHPPYIAAVRKDSTAPDFTACDMSGDPSFRFTPRKVMLYEDAAIRLVGHTFVSFWRPDVVDFRVGREDERGLHLVQLIKRGPRGEVEILVVYPADGYWRVKPLPPQTLKDTAYGSSFLFGPIEEGERPFVAIRSISLRSGDDDVPARLPRWHERRARRSPATPAGTRLALALDPPVAARPAFRRAALDVRDAGTGGRSGCRVAGRARRAPILDSAGSTRARVRFGRVKQSRHNLSAPDLVFDGFATAAAR